MRWWQNTDIWVTVVLVFGFATCATREFNKTTRYEMCLESGASAQECSSP